MSLLNIKKSANFTTGSSMLDSLTAKLKSRAEICSFESNGTVAENDLILFSQEALALDGQGSSAAVDENANGLAASAFLFGQGGNPMPYAEQLAQESTAISGAVSYASDYDNIYAAESFDNQVLNEYMPVSIALAYTTGKQSAGIEAIYRTVNLTPEQGGIEIECPVLYTQNTLRHDGNGSPTDFGLTRVIDAAIDHRILLDNSTKIIPGFASETAASFVAPAVAGSWPENAENGRVVTTGALKIGKQINLLALGHRDTVARSGTPDFTEALDRNVGVDKAFLALGNETIAFPIAGVPFSRFVKGPEQGTRKLILNLPLRSITIDKNTKAWDGSVLTGTVFETIRDGGYRVRLSTTLTGDVDVERGVISVNATAVAVHSITDAAGSLVPTSAAIYTTITNGLSAMKVEGWTVDARVTNTNHRYLGLMLNVRSAKERLTSRMRSPIFMPQPTGEDRSAQILQYLTFTVQTQKDADGLTQLIQYHQRLMDLTGGMSGELVTGDFEENALPIEGIGRNLINPYVKTLEVDLDSTQALDTVSKIRNAQETLLNTIRSVYFDIMQRTNYENAARYLDGGQVAKKFTMTMMTSDTTSRFMTQIGDTRTLGADVPFKFESSVDRRLKDEVSDVDSIYLTITREGTGIDPLNAGVLLNTPALVTALQVTRDNSTRKEIVVQPRYAHYNLCPIVVKISVKGVHKLLKESLPFKVDGLVTPLQEQTPPVGEP